MAVSLCSAASPNQTHIPRPSKDEEDGDYELHL